MIVPGLQLDKSGGKDVEREPSKMRHSEAAVRVIWSRAFKPKPEEHPVQISVGMRRSEKRKRSEANSAELSNRLRHLLHV